MLTESRAQHLSNFCDWNAVVYSQLPEQLVRNFGGGKRTQERQKNCPHQSLVVGQHDDNLCIVIPDHPPKVFSCVRQGMLGNDELITPVVSLCYQCKTQSTKLSHSNIQYK